MSAYSWTPSNIRETEPLSNMFYRLAKAYRQSAGPMQNRCRIIAQRSFSINIDEKQPFVRALCNYVQNRIVPASVLHRSSMLIELRSSVRLHAEGFFHCKTFFPCLCCARVVQLWHQTTSFLHRFCIGLARRSSESVVYSILSMHS